MAAPAVAKPTIAAKERGNVHSISVVYYSSIGLVCISFNAITLVIINLNCGFVVY